MTLGKFLKSIRKHNNINLVDLDNIATMLKSKNLEYSKFGKSHSFFSMVENDKYKIRPDKLKVFLEYIANVYKTNVVLLLSYFSTNRTEIVHLSKATDFEHMPIEDQKLEGIGYRIGKYRLQNSSITFSSFDIAKGKKTENIRHPGEEILIVRSGIVDVVFDELNERKTLSEGDILHFKSTIKHFVENCHTENANLYVIRKFD